MTPAYFTLNPRLDREKLRADFRRLGRLDIPDFLGDDGALLLRKELVARSDWMTVINAGEKIYEISRSGLAELNDAQRGLLDAKITEAARNEFQYRYEALRVPDDQALRRGAQDLLTAFVSFLSSPAALDFFRYITADETISFADGQATAYSTGHFLSRHDDDVIGKGRRCAYVLGLTPAWRAEWGGLLMFHGADGNIVEAFTPRMAALRLFRIPAVHSVSYVTPFAPEPRLSVTGWLRAL